MEFYKSFFIKQPGQTLSFAKSFFCGLLAGLNAITITFPLDVVRTRLAANTLNSSVKDTHLIKSLKELYLKEGIRGLYKGYSVTFIVNYVINKGLYSFRCY